MNTDTDFYAGVAVGVTSPALFAIAILVGRALLRAAGGALKVTAVRIRSTDNREQRAATAAVVYSARVARMVSTGNIALIVVRGTNPDDRVDAYRKLRPTVSLRKIAKPEGDA